MRLGKRQPSLTSSRLVPSAPTPGTSGSLCAPAATVGLLIDHDVLAQRRRSGALACRTLPNVPGGTVALSSGHYDSLCPVRVGPDLLRTRCRVVDDLDAVPPDSSTRAP